MTVRVKMTGHEEAIIVQDIVLMDGIETIVAHDLGVAPRFVIPSCPRGPTATGYIEEVRPARLDRTRHVVLRGVGWGAPITIDVLVVP